ncbi:unnamed protein product [Adineta steineri]|uniref:Uncharacterized protein n=1 Tax=Adineta steineri TaxID=433720 RepID=A0A818K9X7_9BILA|nr:unnamed protein product [Adineta steineri]CAF3548444.1 unnamed protein product [Adineta steineri]
MSNLPTTFLTHSQRVCRLYRALFAPTHREHWSARLAYRQTSIRKAQYPPYFAMREKRKKVYMDWYVKRYGIPDPSMM